MVVHVAAAAGLASRVLGRIRLVHGLPARLRRVLQPEEALDALNHGQHHGLGESTQKTSSGDAKTKLH